MFLSLLSCSLFSYAANPHAVIVKCDGCAYDVDVDRSRSDVFDKMSDRGCEVCHNITFFISLRILKI